MRLLSNTAIMNTTAHITINQPSHEALFAGNGEMAALMRAFDWSATPLGPVESWSPALRMIVPVLLANRFPLLLWWGPHYIQFYNEAYRPVPGDKHPARALGRPARECWSEIWEVIAPLIDTPFQGGPATWMDDIFLLLNRYGYDEETHFTIAYSPVPDETAPGGIGGVLATVHEITEKVIGERRLALLREVASALTSAQTTEDVVSAVARCVEVDARDLPFTLLYLFDGDGSTARLVSMTGVSAGDGIAVPVIGREEGDTHWPLSALLTERVPVLMDNLSERYGSLPFGSWDKPPQQALVSPIAQQGQKRPAGFLVTALNSYRKCDADYSGFVSLLAGQIASSLANVRAYEAERARAEALAQLDLAKTAFFTNISHEFRTPLTLMLGPMEDALSTDGQALTGERLQTVHRNSLRLLKLVNTLLDFSRIEAGRVQASYQPTDLAAYTKELASVFRSAMERAGMRFVVDCPPLSELACIDRDMWEKIVLNLLSNAFKFTFEGEIAVTLHEADGQAVLAVGDTGTGITQEQLPHIFERFHRIEGTRARTHEGTGIGLALVQELVKLHGGTVEVESTEGVGTTFIVTLPLGTAHLPPERISAPVTLSSTALRAEAFVEEALRWLPEESQEVVASTPIQQDGQAEGMSRARILLADDNADMRDYVQRLLHQQYDVTTVANGKEALQAIGEEKPDLILSDAMMPELDGFGLLQALRSDPYTASLPVILLSARAGEEAQIEGLSAGADDYLIKPFSARELLARVQSQLTLARLRDETAQAIRERETELKEAQRLARIGSWYWDAATDGITGSEELYRIYGLDTHQSFPDFKAQDGWLYPHESWARINAATEDTVRTGLGYALDVSAFRDGEPIWITIQSDVIKNASGAVASLRGTVQDITERKRIEETLSERNREVEELNRRLQQAMTETHHRVKNNLQLMSALIDMQCMSGEDMIPRSEMTRLAANVRALSVIHDMLTQETKAGNDHDQLSAKAVLEELTQMLLQTAGDRELQMTLDDAMLAGRQATALALVTNELVTNALKHSTGKTEITFRAEGDTATLEVCDDGPGFPHDFDPMKATHTGLELVESVIRWDLKGLAMYTQRPEGGGRVTVSFPIIIHKDEPRPAA